MPQSVLPANDLMLSNIFLLGLEYPVSVAKCVLCNSHSRNWDTPGLYLQETADTSSLSVRLQGGKGAAAFEPADCTWTLSS